ncbi:MAG: exodeoxyribonuclease VII large subunit [Lachnospiraceae bacterium]|nr:exodeoxyribonuclease VII large subunit [Lachnospiraceae bacterium]
MANIYSVSQVNSYIKNMFTQDFMLAHIFIRGEVSNCKYHTSGHIYFTVKDERAAMACVMFAGNRKGLLFTLKEGQKIVVEGSVSVYEQSGSYQLYAKRITLDGTGLLYQRYEELKSRLEEMGMFSEEYKKPIPRYATRIGIVTAQTGAAVRDIMTIAKRRNPYVQLYLYSALVQGEGAKESIVHGIEVLDEMNLDVLIVGRGGGSIEDLWAFNEECVARAIFECNTPVISAVGHEVDVTIADYVADLRAPTPSAAAELAVFDYAAFEERQRALKAQLMLAMDRRVEQSRIRLRHQELQLKAFSPAQRILEKRQRAIAVADRLEHRMEELMSDRKHRLALYAQKLHGLSPLISLERGYSYVQNEEGKAVRSVTQIKQGEMISARFVDGSARAEIIEISEQRSE